MHIEYRSTEDELIEMYFRLAKLTGRLKQDYSAVIVIAILFAAVLFWMFRSILLTSYTPTVFILVVSLLMFLKMHSDFHSNFRKRIRKRLKKLNIAPESALSHYEITPDVLSFSRDGQEIRFNWETVQTISIDDSYIEVIMEPKGIALLPLRIFDTEELKDEWIHTMYSYMNSKKGMHTE